MKLLLLPLTLILPYSSYAATRSSNVINDTLVKGIHSASVKKWAKCDKLLTKNVSWNCPRAQDCEFHLSYLCDVKGDSGCWHDVMINGDYYRKEVSVTSVDFGMVCE